MTEQVGSERAHSLRKSPLFRTQLENSAWTVKWSISAAEILAEEL
jgi:hypothetical protein